jgi:hypothetical protein
MRWHVLFGMLLIPVSVIGAEPPAHSGATSLTDSSIRYRTPESPLVVLQRGDVRAIIVDNRAVDSAELPGHRAGYNGIASLVHSRRPENLFVRAYAGINLEHIHDGTGAVEPEIFEPRQSAMELRVVDRQTVELYQPPTPKWKLESCGRFHMLDDGTIEYTFECIPRADLFRNRFLGLFWASYIDKPEDIAINFRGLRSQCPGSDRWIRAVSPEHGVAATHPPVGPRPKLVFDEPFRLTLTNNLSEYVISEPWYYGVSHGMAYVLMFRAQDGIWPAQSPSGGGGTNPAWDFQWFVPHAEVGKVYRFVMRIAYLPFTGRDQLIEATRKHREELN